MRPEHFVPIHGEYRMLLAHARTALRMGVPASGVFVIEDGESVVVDGGRMRLGDPVPSGRVWLDARGGRDVSEIVLRERERISGQGILMAIVVADRKTGEILRGPPQRAIVAQRCGRRRLRDGASAELARPAGRLLTQ